MSAEESHGSHSLTPFAAQLEPTIPQSPQLKKKMGVHQKDTTQNLPPDVYELLKTPPSKAPASAFAIPVISTPLSPIPPVIIEAEEMDEDVDIGDMGMP